MTDTARAVVSVVRRLDLATPDAPPFPMPEWKDLAAGIACGGLALLGNLLTDRFISRGPRTLFFSLLGDERCASDVAPSIASMCGKGIGTSFSPSPAVCAIISTLLVSILPLAVIPLMPSPKPGSGVSSAQPLLLCFACGGLLGDVFLHILPHTLAAGHGHDEHDEHHGGDEPYEWGGLFATPSSSYTWVAQAVGSPLKYAEAHMKAVFLPAAAATSSALSALASEAVHSFSASCTDVYPGGTITPTADSCVNLHFVTDSTSDSTFTLNTAAVSNLAVFTEHVPTEFERDTHYFQAVPPSDVEPIAIIGAALSSSGHSHDHGHSHGGGHAGHDHGGGGGGHEHSMEEAMGGLAVLIGFAVFFLVEKLVRSRAGGHGHSHGSHSHSHQHHHGEKKKKEEEHHDHDHAADGSCCEHGHDEDGGSHEHSHEHSAVSPGGARKRRAATSPKRTTPRAASPAKQKPSSSKGSSKASSSKKKASSPSHEHGHSSEHSHQEEAAPSSADASSDGGGGSADSKIGGYLNLAADAAHNFTDGLMIGANYTQGFTLGVSSTIACIMHEVSSSSSRRRQIRSPRIAPPSRLTPHTVSSLSLARTHTHTHMRIGPPRGR